MVKSSAPPVEVPLAEERRLDFLILTMPDKEIVSLSLREGVDYLDEDWPEFGDFYVLETA